VPAAYAILEDFNAVVDKCWNKFFSKEVTKEA
jgi:hypothetical protein